MRQYHGLMNQTLSYQLRTLLLLFMVLVVAAPQGLAQVGVDARFNRANQHFRQGQYQEALSIFRSLHKENPATFIFLEKTAESLINLKRYDEAIQLTRESKEESLFPGQSSILLGKIYHIMGDTTQAHQVWDNVLEQNRENLQLYIIMGRTMIERRAFDQAVQVYERAKEVFSSSTLITSELAGTYMQAGKYEQAVREFLNLVKKQPDRIDFVQRNLLRYQDQYLYDTAILEIEEFLDELPLRHQSHLSLHQLHLWLLMERNLYERALAAAQNYESRTSTATYSLYGLGSKLLSERKFELAEQAYRYYIDNNMSAAKYRSMEELANVYIEWSDYLSDFNIAYSARRDSLYQRAFKTLQRLRDEAPAYNRMGNVLLRQAELALDYLHNVNRARTYLQALIRYDVESLEAREHYLEGRIYLYEKEYDRARIAFTKSRKSERNGGIAEKVHYYLALTDFYAGEYEFAKIQLNALERQNTSYFANDAVRLRVWIQEGNQDSLSREAFANAMEAFNRGDRDRALRAMKPILGSGSNILVSNPYSDDALLELSNHITPASAKAIYTLIDRYLSSPSNSTPLRERLIWEQARIADQVVTHHLTLDSKASPGSLISDLYLTNSEPYSEIPNTREKLAALYENLLFTFPNGFYASFARDRIQELKSSQPS